MLFIKGIYLLLSHLPTSPTIGLRIHIVRHPSDCANGAIHRHRRKTAEERFHTLARGWLAYPVTPTHHQSTAEERLYMSTHPSVCNLSSQSDGTLP